MIEKRPYFIDNQIHTCNFKPLDWSETEGCVWCLTTDHVGNIFAHTIRSHKIISPPLKSCLIPGSCIANGRHSHPVEYLGSRPGGPRFYRAVSVLNTSDPVGHLLRNAVLNNPRGLYSIIIVYTNVLLNSQIGLVSSSGCNPDTGIFMHSFLYFTVSMVTTNTGTCMMKQMLHMKGILLMWSFR